MPKVGKKRFPATRQGEKDAIKEAKERGLPVDWTRAEVDKARKKGVL